MLFVFFNHSFGKHGLNHFVYVVRWFKLVIPLNSIIVYFARVSTFFVSDAPVEANVTCSLVAKLKRTLSLFIANSPKNKQSLFCFAQICRVLFDIRISDIDLSGRVDFCRNRKSVMF